MFAEVRAEFFLTTAETSLGQRAHPLGRNRGRGEQSSGGGKGGKPCDTDDARPGEELGQCKDGLA